MLLLIEVKRNFIDLSAKKTLLIKNPFYSLLHNNPNLKLLKRKPKSENKNNPKRNSNHYQKAIKIKKNLLGIQIMKKLYYENYFNKENKTLLRLNKGLQVFFVFKKQLNSLLGLLIFFKIKIVKKLNYLLLIFLLLYFELNESIFSYFLDPPYEHNLFPVDKLSYLPDKVTFRKLMKEKAYEKSDSITKKIGTAKKLQEFRESFELKDIFKEFFEKRLLKYEWIKILFSGSNYQLEKKVYNPNEILDSLNLNEENDKEFYIFNQYWKQSFILRRIQGVFSGLKRLYNKIRYFLLGDETLTLKILRFCKMENYYFYRKMTLNERLRVKIEYLKGTRIFKALIDHIEQKYTEKFIFYLKKEVLNFLKNKEFKDDLFKYLVNLLFVNIDYRDFLLEKLCVIILDFVNSTLHDDVII